MFAHNILCRNKKEVSRREIFFARRSPFLQNIKTDKSTPGRYLPGVLNYLLKLFSATNRRGFRLCFSRRTAGGFCSDLRSESEIFRLFIYEVNRRFSGDAFRDESQGSSVPFFGSSNLKIKDIAKDTCAAIHAFSALRKIIRFYSRGIILRF